MSISNDSLHLPAYQSFLDAISVFDLPISPSELHGTICGYLCAQRSEGAASYLRALTMNHSRDENTRLGTLALFEMLTVSQQQLQHFDFEFQMLLPSEGIPLADRAQAFGEWCVGFINGMQKSGIDFGSFNEEESQEAFQHLKEFSHLDYESLEVSEDDEKALFEVSEYAKFAVIRIFEDLIEEEPHSKSSAH